MSRSAAGIGPADNVLAATADAAASDAELVHSLEHPEVGLLSSQQLPAVVSLAAELATSMWSELDISAAVRPKLESIRGQLAAARRLLAETTQLVGTEPAVILEEASRLLSDVAAYEAMSRAVNPFGDGKASQRILELSRSHLGV